MPVKLHAHQEEALEKMHNGCILYGGVGVGKTITSLGYYFSKVCNGEINKWGSMETPKDVYVITTAKVRDSKAFELQAAHYGVHEDPAISTNGVRITVDSWNNLHKYVEVKDAFFIFDEQRVVGYGAWARAFIKIARANEWILLSATPGDTWLDYIPVFIANGWYKHKTDFIDQHVIWTPRVKYPKVLRYQDVGILVRRRNDVLVHMPYERHTVRHHVDIWCDYDQDLFDQAVKKRWHVFEKRPLRDVSELFGVMRKVVNSDATRVDAVRSLTHRHPKLIVFYNFDYELEMLRELGECIQKQTKSFSSEFEKTESREGNPSSGNWELSSTTSGGHTTAPAMSAETTAVSATPSDVLSDWEWLLSPDGKALQESLLLSKSSSDSSTENSTSDSPTGSELGSRSTGKTTSGTSSFTIAEGKTEVCPNQSTTTDSTKSQTGHLSSSATTQQRKSSKHSVDSTSAAELSSEGSNISSVISTPANSSATATKAFGQTFSVAEWNGHKHQEIPTTERWLYLVQYRAGAEGWNCVETDAICFFSQTYSYRDWWQAHGRIDRINTMFTDLWYYHLVSRSIIDKAIRKALKAKKSFNERDLDLKVG